MNTFSTCLANLFRNCFAILILTFSFLTFGSLEASANCSDVSANAKQYLQISQITYSGGQFTISVFNNAPAGSCPLNFTIASYTLYSDLAKIDDNRIFSISPQQTSVLIHSAASSCSETMYVLSNTPTTPSSFIQPGNPPFSSNVLSNGSISNAAPLCVCSQCHVPTATPTPTCTPTPTPKTPTCDAGGPYSGSAIVCSATPITVQLNGGHSVDPNAHGSLSYSWTTNCPNAVLSDATASSPTITLATAGNAGTASVQCNINLKVTSSFGTSESCQSPFAAQPCVRDCAGTINGTAKVDSCGVCNGDGQSCVPPCTQKDIKVNKLAIDANANSLRDLTFKVNKELLKVAKQSKLTKSQLSSLTSYVLSSNQAANKTYIALWNLDWSSFPTVILSCNSNKCPTVSTEGTKNGIKDSTLKLSDYVKKGAAKIQSLLTDAKRRKLPGVALIAKSAKVTNAYATSAQNLGQSNVVQLNSIPSGTSSCS